MPEDLRLAHAAPRLAPGRLDCTTQAVHSNPTQFSISDIQTLLENISFQSFRRVQAICGAFLDELPTQLKEVLRG